MKKQVSLLLLCVVLPTWAWSQAAVVKLKVRVVLVDKDLNQKPVPRLMVSLQRLDGTVAVLAPMKTALDGTSESSLPPGKYKITTPDPVDFQGKRYAWEVEFVLSGSEFLLELSNDNAKIVEGTPDRPARLTDELTTTFKRYQNSVVTVWSEIGHGTGFFVDSTGLVLTNQHVIGPSEYIAIQFDESRKLPARLVASDPERDIAVLWTNLTALPEAMVVPIARGNTGEALVLEGERVFTIGSPMNQRKIVTTGIVSKVEPRAIIADININPGNSGGPLFNSLGEVVGLTTFGEQRNIGPGISGIVRIELALPLIESAKKKVKDMTPPEIKFLPVEPRIPFPIDAIKEAIMAEKFDTKAYVFGAGDYDVALVTPISKYRHAHEAKIAAVKEKEKRNKKKPEAVGGTFRPLDDLKNWEEYAGGYQPVILIRASPKLRETFWSAFGRGLAASGGYYGGPAKMRFKTDFYRMKLLCDARQIEPINPGKIADAFNVQSPFVRIVDATYEGLYTYPPDSISTSCQTVTLELYSEKDPNKPTVKILDKKTVERIWADFAPFREMPKASSGNPSPSRN